MALDLQLHSRVLASQPAMKTQTAFSLGERITESFEERKQQYGINNFKINQITIIMINDYPPLYPCVCVCVCVFYIMFSTKTMLEESK